MNPIEQIDIKQVRLFKNVLHSILEGLVKAGVKLEPLAAAAAAEEFAADLRQRSAEDAKPKNYPDYIG